MSWWDAAALEIEAPVTNVERRCDILNSDGTLWLPDAGIISGTVSVDQTRDERRTLDIELDNPDGSLRSYPGAFWYDKIIRPQRGVRYATGIVQTWPLGDFLIDNISDTDFPRTVKVTGRDRTKQLIEDKFEASTLFGAGGDVGLIVYTIAVNGGVATDRIIVDAGEAVIDKDQLWEADTTRWSAIMDLCNANALEAFFNASGYLIVRPYRDPVTMPPTMRFRAGAGGNLASFTRKTDGDNIYNAVTVRGQSSDPNVLPVVVTLENHDPNSPTSIENYGRRKVWVEPANPLITSYDQAYLAASYKLKFLGLEDYSVQIATLVYPWLEAGEVVQFDDPDPVPGEPSRFLFTDFTIPLGLGQGSTGGGSGSGNGAMTGNARRVVIVG